MSGNGRGFKEMANDEQILRTLVERIVEHLKPERIYLFGSKARGDAGPDSDFDLLVVVGNSSKPGYRRDIDAYRAVRDVPMAKDILVWTRDEFDSRLHICASLPATVVREGRLLYAA